MAPLCDVLGQHCVEKHANPVLQPLGPHRARPLVGLMEFMPLMPFGGGSRDIEQTSSAFLEFTLSTPKTQAASLQALMILESAKHAVLSVAHRCLPGYTRTHFCTGVYPGPLAVLAWICPSTAAPSGKYHIQVFPGALC